jgi:hypothetical protein
MPAKSSKQADRAALKKAAKAPVDEPENKPQTGGKIVERAKDLFLGSVLVKAIPRMQGLIGLGGEFAMPPAAAAGDSKKEDEDDTNEPATNEEKEESTTKSMPEEMFGSLQTHLAWHNCLGLATPASGAEAVNAWKAMKGLECDFGPKSKKRGTPGLDRVLGNLSNFMPQYLHVLLALMVLRAFLFRSYFACLPWLLVYQFLSLLVPLTNDSLPDVLKQVPIEKCPVQYRVVATLAINALVWLFFAYEFVWRSYFFEKAPYLGLLAYHAYAFRVADQ